MTREPHEKIRVAVIDDDSEIQVVLCELFRLEGYETESFLSGNEALARKAPNWDLIVCDLKLPDTDGLELIARLRERGMISPVVLITAHATIETAVQALRNGAFDYIAKPINPVELSVIADRAVKLHRLEQNYERLRKQVEQTWHRGSLIGRSHKMRKVFSLIDRVSPSTANVIITGESGTGKEMVARAIHAASPRASEPFVAVNCSSIPDNLLESELFGHRKGAFTGAVESRQGLFEEADGGTLFLDEIGDMPIALQAKLLRVLQERKIKPVGSNELKQIDVRIIAATHRDLKMAISEGKFREDLYFRLCVVPVSLPPLRERLEDIPLLADHFLAKYCERNNVPLKRLTKAAYSKLQRMEWPGNVRELENTVERAVVLSHSDLIDENEIFIDVGAPAASGLRGFFAKFPTLTQLEREYVLYILSETGNYKERAAEILGINRKTLYRKEREFGITREPSAGV